MIRRWSNIDAANKPVQARRRGTLAVGSTFDSHRVPRCYAIERA
jgi:hypothetical protein